MGQSDPDGQTAAESYHVRAVEWLLFSGDRELVALGILGLPAVFFTALVWLGVAPLLDTQSLFYVYSGLIAGNLTLITVVVSINQLLLSRELQTPGELGGQIEDVVDYRKEVEDATGEIAPVKPMGFLQLLVEATREEAQRLGGFAQDGVVGSGSEEIDDIVTTLTRQMDRVDSLLTESDAGTFSVLSLMLETNYAVQINKLRETQKHYGDDLADVVHESIDDLIDRLQEIDVARQYFKSIYLKQELSQLSRVLLYAGIPAEVIAITTLLVFTIPSGRPEATVDLRVFLPVTLTVGLVPLALLGSYILRTATVTKLTAATLPFTTPEQER